MKNLEGFYSEEELQKLLFDGEIDHLSFVNHHSEEMIGEFAKFCAKYGLEHNNKAAQQFISWQLKNEEDGHTDGLD